MPLQATSGAASYDAFGGGVPVEPVYIEQIFQTWLYTGTGGTQTITNGINLSGKGGLVWVKSRAGASGSEDHILVDTVRGTSSGLRSNTTGAASGSGGFTSFNADGFSFGSAFGIRNDASTTYASWTFRKQPKFFDVVTWTGNGANRTIAHNLGSVPGCIIVKRTDTTADWQVYHRSLANTEYLVLNSTAAVATGATRWNSTTPTSTVFSLGTDATVNASGGTYVAYVYAHDAGGFGLTGTDNVISCGSFTTDGSSNYSVTLGYEPQWVLWKRVNTTGNWQMYDNMRGMGVAGTSFVLYPDLSNAEAGPNSNTAINSTGFTGTIGSASQTYIYIAIRRGPMKVPTTGTSVFSPVAYTGNGSSNRFILASLTPDFVIGANRTSTYKGNVVDRLRGRADIVTNTTAAEAAPYDGLNLVTRSGGLVLDASTGGSTGYNITSNTYVNWLFGRAPGFFDVVCYRGNDTNMTIQHNLGVTPELLIVKNRTNTLAWFVYSKSTTTPNNYYLLFNTNNGELDAGAQVWNNTATTFLASTGLGISANSDNFVAYLFASCPGVSKVFSYTGNGSSQTINCGFTSGARFVMVKRTDSTGNWLVVDTARGLVSAGDPTLYLNSTAAEVTGVDWIDPDNSGFIVNQEGTMNANVSSATYIGLAIA